MAGYDGEMHRLSIVTKDVDYVDVSARDNVFSLFNELEATSVSASSVEEWITPFAHWLNHTHSEAINDITDSHQFYAYLKSFAAEDEYRHFGDEIVFDEDTNPTSIESTRFVWTIRKAGGYASVWESRQEMNGIMSQSGINGYIFNMRMAVSYFLANTPLFAAQSLSLGLHIRLCYGKYKITF